MITSNSILEKNASLEEMIQYVMSNSPFYQDHFKDANVGDFESLPFTTKEDVAAQNERFCCVEMSKIAEYVTTSGTSGEPITIYLTKNDLERLAENERASLTLMNGSEGDLYQLLTTVDKQFMAGIAYYLGVQKMNAGIIRQGPGAISAQWDSILKYKPTKLIAVPSFILLLLDYADKNGIDYNKTSIDSIICIGESIRDNSFNYNLIGSKITSKWDVKLFSTYASTEMATAFSECKMQNGGHLNKELLHLEVLREDDTHVSNGEEGEIVITTLGVEGTPLIRYRTGDIAKFWSDKCKCESSSPRIGPIIGRKSQLIKFKGTSIYPQSIYNVLMSFDKIDLYHILVDQIDMTAINLKILLSEKEVDVDLSKELLLKLKTKLKVAPELLLVPEKELKKHIINPGKRKPNYITFL